MRVAVLGLISAFSVLPLAANAVPTGLSTPTVVSARGVQLVAGSSPNADQYTSKARRARHHPQATHRGSASPSDNMAGQLNAQEAASHAGGGMGSAPAPAYGGPTNKYGQPNQIYGIPGAGQPSAGNPVPGAR